MQPAEAKLVERSLGGDLAAFNQIVDSYQSLVYNVSARVLGDRTTAEDVTQETFIAAFRALKSFRGGNLRAWLLRIARNLCYDQLRSQKRRPAGSLDEALEQPGFVPPTSGEPSPEEQALSGELGAAINGISFTVEDTSDLEVELRESAVADALTKADHLASLSGVDRGRLVFLTQLGSTSGQDFSGGVADVGIALSKAAPSSPVSGGELELTLRVQAMFEID